MVSSSLRWTTKYVVRLELYLLIITIDESDLNSVLTACKTCATKWDRIGLRLGLPKSSLDIIKDQQHSDPVKCLYEML